MIRIQVVWSKTITHLLLAPGPARTGTRQSPIIPASKSFLTLNALTIEIGHLTYI